MIDHDALAQHVLNRGISREARAWLAENRDASRTLGEDLSHAESVSIIDRLYECGAVAVHAAEIDTYDDDQQNTGKLVIELPQDADARRRILDYTSQWATRRGFDPDEDMGQRYATLFLD